MEPSADQVSEIDRVVASWGDDYGFDPEVDLRSLLDT